MFDKKSIVCKGAFRLVPLEGKIIKKGERVHIVKPIETIDGLWLTRIKTGRILRIFRKGNKMQLDIAFKKCKKEKSTTKKELVVQVLKHTDLRKKHLMKLFEKGLMHNFTIEDLKEFTKQKIKFVFPKKFRGTFMEGRIYLQVDGKYYEM